MFFHRTWQECNYINDTVCAYTSMYYTFFNFTLSRQVVWNIIVMFI